MTFNAGGGTLDTGGLAIVLTDPIGNNGPGTLTKAGQGSLTLLGNATYAGNTVLTAGTLQLGNGGGSGWILGDVVNSGLLSFNRSDSLTFPGAISGSGAVVQMGPGQLTLTGSNSYGGGTTISAGTLMVGSGGTLGILPGDTLNNAVLVFNHSDTYTYPGVISGNGSVTQAGSGTLVYLGANSYGGGTTIASGVLQIGSGGTAGVLPGNTVDNSLLVFNRADTYVYPGVISGSGAVIQAGGGATILTASNLYTGGTTVSAGILQLGDGAVSNGSVPGNIVNNALLYFANPYAQTFSGVISGNGSLMKEGTGLLTLGGSNTYTGWTRIAAGVLQTANSAALQLSTLATAHG
jgi:autotransporter-associated beta strand protein